MKQTMTKDEVKATIIGILKKEEKPVNPSVIIQKNGWKKDDIESICKQFQVKSFNELLRSFSEIQISKDEHATPSVQLKHTVRTMSKPQPVSDEKTPHALHERIKLLLSYLNQNLYGKDEAVRLALLSAVAGESIFFMGPPGTAKSMVSRRIAAAFKDFYEDGTFSTEKGGYFEYLMNEFSTPDEICGPVDLSALNEKPSRYERQTEGYLPSAKIAFLDEIWKSGPAILNTLLTIINEKKFHNGKNVWKVPLVSLASASNELPEKNRGLEALWDRFILRVFVNPVANEDDFFKVVDDGNKELVLTEEQKSVLLAISEVEKWQTEINKVELSDEARAVITAIRKELVSLNTDDKHKDDEAYYVSDRRWKKIVHILKTSAFLNGRTAVDLMDCSLIEYAIWNTDKQHDEVGGIVEKILKQNGIGKVTAISDISDQVDEFKNSVDEKWFEEICEADTPEQDAIVTVDNKKCYKCTRSGTNETWYVTMNTVKDSWGNNSNCHNVYDTNKSYRTTSSFQKNGNEIYCNWNFTINKTNPIPGRRHKELKLFEPVAKKTVMESFDKEEYTPIVEQIDSEIADLHNFRAENEKPFAENAFSDTTRYCPVLLNKIDESIRILEDLKLKLKEQHERYASEANVKSDFELGDIILKDGTYKKAEEEDDNDNILMKICLKGDSVDSAYGMAWMEYDGECGFETTKDVISEYSKKFSEPYNTDWMLPTIEQWQQIYANTHSENNLKLSGKYWSASEDKEKGGVWYFNFDTGEKECTLPSNKYGIILIRKLAL